MWEGQRKKSWKEVEEDLEEKLRKNRKGWKLGEGCGRKGRNEMGYKL